MNLNVLLKIGVWFTTAITSLRVAGLLVINLLLSYYISTTIGGMSGINNDSALLALRSIAASIATMGLPALIRSIFADAKASKQSISLQGIFQILFLVSFIIYTYYSMYWQLGYILDSPVILEKSGLIEIESMDGLDQPNYEKVGYFKFVVIQAIIGSVITDVLLGLFSNEDVAKPKKEDKSKKGEEKKPKQPINFDNTFYKNIEALLKARAEKLNIPYKKWGKLQPNTKVQIKKSVQDSIDSGKSLEEAMKLIEEWFSNIPEETYKKL